MKYILPQKSDFKQIDINEFSAQLPDLKNNKDSKSTAIGKWLISSIENSKNIKPGYLLPSKPDMAYLLGVSVGTIQNALRYIEDLGYVESKQCIGTMIKDQNNAQTSFRKLTSKREIAINKIKEYIINKNLTQGDQLASVRNIASEIENSLNTTRLALEYLATCGILENDGKNWHIKSTDFSTDNIKNVTLVQKVENDLKDYITENLHIGDRIPAHGELAKRLSASIKTIHDALTSLIKEGILLAKRGRYGTTVVRMPNSLASSERKETSIFASAPETAFYYYEKTQNHIKRMISENYEIGSKLPSVAEMAEQLDVSPNTIRKAFHNLAKEGYLAFSRGRYGGTFVIDIPESDGQTFKWLAVNPKYAEVYKN